MGIGTVLRYSKTTGYSIGDRDSIGDRGFTWAGIILEERYSTQGKNLSYIY